MIARADLEALLSDDDSDEYCEFGRIEIPAHARPDMCALLVLDRLVPGDRDIICDAEHDEIWLDIDINALCEAATVEDITTLIRCGVRYDRRRQTLAMFV